MIENLTVENYRSFKNYSMQGLKRVNLLTGLNNSGKTSLLEAVELINSDAASNALAKISLRRGELLARDTDRTVSRREWVDYSGFFPGHAWSVESKIFLIGERSGVDAYSTKVTISAPKLDPDSQRPSDDPLYDSQSVVIRVKFERPSAISEK